MKANYEFLEEMVEDVVHEFEEKFERIEGYLRVIAEILEKKFGGDGDDLEDSGSDEKEPAAPRLKIGADIENESNDTARIARIFGNL